ncbi:MAG TPA: hypothetical protein DCO79_09435 [Spirochaeta sp.]|nr:hypothetical protein [Spirochaeta sp.]
MAVKTITIDMEAYNLLSEQKQKNESFSKVIKRTFKASKKTGGSLLENLHTFILEEDTLDQTEEIVKSREEDYISSEKIESES